MKIELNDNKIYFNNGTLKKEIHSFWLRERVDGEEFLDKGTQQRIFDPSTMNGEIIIKKVPTIRIFISTFLFFSAMLSWGQSVIESNESPKILLNPTEKKGPSLLQPKKEKSFLSEDFFNPKIEFEDPKNDIENPRLRFGENEQFLDPGKQYLNKLNRKPEKEKNPDLFKTDQYLGDFRNNGKFVQIAVRDHESPDGDLIRIMLNDVEVVSQVMLQERFKSISIDLVMGFNKIDFVALNQGASGPNTAEVRVFDDNGQLVGANRWNLATGVKATYIIVKEK